MASTYLSRTTVTPTNGQKGTFSTWVRVDKVGAQKIMINYSDSTNYSYIRFHPSKFLQCYATLSDSVVNNYKTERFFLDFNGWYHIVVRIDTTQATATDRLRLYVNGELQTAYDTQTYSGSQNAQHPILIASATNNHRIGADEGPADYFNGLMSHFHFCDGYSYDASAFGETDATTGEWKINTSPSVTYGTNGFFILKDGNSVTDQSGNSNNFTVGGGTLTKTEDCPSNVFATMNPLSAGSDMAFTFGNTGIRNDVSTWNSGLSTIAPATGKYYWEVYVHGGGDNNTGVSLSSAYGGTHSEVDAGRIVYSRNGYIYREGLSGQSNVTTGVTYGDGDYIGVAFDTENGILTFYKNGTAVTNGSTTDTSFLRSNNEYIAQCGLYNGGEFRFNFGNGAFGSTQLTGTTYQGDGNIGIFKYDPPTGFTALSTKGLNE